MILGSLTSGLSAILPGAVTISAVPLNVITFLGQPVTFQTSSNFVTYGAAA